MPHKSGYNAESYGAPTTKEPDLGDFAPKGDFQNINHEPGGGLEDPKDAVDAGAVAKEINKAVAAFGAARAAGKSSSIKSHGPVSIPKEGERTLGNPKRAEGPAARRT